MATALGTLGLIGLAGAGAGVGWFLGVTGPQAKDKLVRSGYT